MDTQDLLDNDLSIVSIPRVYYQFQEAMCNKNTSFAEIGEIIIHDSGLTARLLRIVNSAFYGFPGKVGKFPMPSVGLEPINWVTSYYPPSS